MDENSKEKFKIQIRKIPVKYVYPQVKLDAH